MRCWSLGPWSWYSYAQEPGQEPWCHPDGDPQGHPELAHSALDNCSSCEKERLRFSVNDSVIKIGVRNCIFRRLAAKTNHLSSSSADNCWIYNIPVSVLLRGPFVLVSEWIYWVCKDTYCQAQVLSTLKFKPPFGIMSGGEDRTHNFSQWMNKTKYFGLRLSYQVASK